jgi:DNA-binding CsgD family transcriptional regulator
MASHPVAGLGDIARARLEHDAALAQYRSALSLARLFGADEAYHERGGFHFELETMDRQRALGLPEPWLRAGASFGAGQPLRDALWTKRQVPIAPIPNPETAATRWQEGRSLSIAEACRLALEADATVKPDTDLDDTAGLSVREREVLRLLADGQTDQAIADALYISRRTAATHIKHIYNKLGVSSRASAAAWAVRHGLA